MNYQQDQGYYEINPVYHVYGDMHPSDEQIYLTKGLEIAAVYGATKLWPEYEKEILSLYHDRGELSQDLLYILPP